MKKLENKTVIITGSSRGIGREIALRCAADGANIVVTGKTAEPHATLPGTIYTVAEEVKQAGGQALAIQLDVREEASVEAMVAKTMKEFGRIDILVNNAGAIHLTGTENTSMKRYDLMQSINTRATFLCVQKTLPHLKKSDHAHILNCSPPISLDPKWLQNHAAYTISKYGMTMLTIGMAEEFREYGIAVNSLWPKTLIATSAVKTFFKDYLANSRKPSITADAAYVILTAVDAHGLSRGHLPSEQGEREGEAPTALPLEGATCLPAGMAQAPMIDKKITGQTFLDEDVLRKNGITDFEKYAYEPGQELIQDLFL
ncbi:MAG: NAD(P)-dependent oxidoreductase [Deltaproteobacteria bacterium]|nr:NAD(P)-dependent oxidoreductase [Deltaproteobacteria bacterium]